MAGKKKETTKENNVENPVENEVNKPTDLDVNDAKQWLISIDVLLTRLMSKTPEPIIRPHEISTFANMRNRCLQHVSYYDPEWLAKAQGVTQSQEKQNSAEETVAETVSN